MDKTKCQYCHYLHEVDGYGNSFIGKCMAFPKWEFVSLNHHCILFLLHQDQTIGKEIEKRSEKLRLEEIPDDTYTPNERYLDSRLDCQNVQVAPAI